MIIYDPKSKRFKDGQGRFVAKSRALKSSTARATYQKAQTRHKIFYSPMAKRFRDNKGRFVAKVRAVKSSTARATFEASQAIDDIPNLSDLKPTRYKKPKLILTEKFKGVTKFRSEPSIHNIYAFEDFESIANFLRRKIKNPDYNMTYSIELHWWGHYISTGESVEGKSETVIQTAQRLYNSFQKQVRELLAKISASIYLEGWKYFIREVIYL